MTTQIYVKPAPGRTARHESTHQPLHKRGAWWPNNAATRRLLKAGDIVEATAPGAAPAKPAGAPPAPPVIKSEPAVTDADIAGKVAAIRESIKPAEPAAKASRKKRMH